MAAPAIVAAPRVSVIIPTYNRAALVVEAIASVLAQTYRDLEVIVCDDGSEDDTGERVGAFGPPVRYLRIEHTGRLGAVRNRAVEAARGELLAFLDDDDLWEPEKLARQIERIDGEPRVEAVYSDRRLLFEDGSLSDTARSPDPDESGRLFDRVLSGDHPSPCTLLVRREALARIGGFDESRVTGEDVALWLRLGRVACARVPEPLTLVRRRDGTLSDRDPPLTYGNVIALLERELATADLRPRQRLRCRRTLAFQYAQLAGVLIDAGDRSAARRAAWRGVGRFPASRNAWRALARALAPN